MKIWDCTPDQLYHSQLYLGGGIPHFNLLLSIIWTYNSHYINFNNSHSPDLLVVLYFGVLILWWDAPKGCLSSVWAPLINDNFATIISRIKMKYWTFHSPKNNWTLPGKYETLGFKVKKTMTKDINIILSVLMMQLGNTGTLHWIRYPVSFRVY